MAHSLPWSTPARAESSVTLLVAWCWFRDTASMRQWCGQRLSSPLVICRVAASLPRERGWPELRGRVGPQYCLGRTLTLSRQSQRHQYLRKNPEPASARPPSQSFSPSSTLSPANLHLYVRSLALEEILKGRALSCSQTRSAPRSEIDRFKGQPLLERASARGADACMQSTLGGLRSALEPLVLDGNLRPDQQP